MYGAKTITTGGKPTKYYASQRLEVKRSEKVKQGEDIVANVTKVSVVKNKIAPPFKVAEFQIGFGIGIDRIAEIIDIALEFGIVKRSGSWFSYGDVKLGQGQVKVIELLRDNEELVEEIHNKVMNMVEG